MLCKYLVLEYDIPIGEKEVRAKVREQFEKNKHVTDMRVIDMLVLKVTEFCKVTAIYKAFSFD